MAPGAFLILFFLGFISSLNAANITSVASGNWATGSTWSTGTVPGATDNVTVAAGHTITMNGNTGSCLSLVVNGTLTWTQTRTTNVGTGGLTLNNGSSAAGSGNGVLNVAGTLTVPSGATATIGNVTLAVTGNTTISGTLIFNSTTGTKDFTNFTINSGGALQTTASETIDVSGDFTMLGGAINGTSTDRLNIGGNFNVTSGTNTMNRCRLAVTGTTTINSTFSLTNTAGSKTLNDLVITSTGNFNCTVAESWAIQGSFTNNGTFTSNTGTYTFSGAGKTFSGTASSVFSGNLTCSGSYTNNGNVTANSSLGGNGSWTQGSGTLNVGCTNANFSVNTFSASGTGNTVNYTRAGNQNVRNPTGSIYYHLGLLGTGTKSLTAATTCNGNVTISSTFDVTNTNYALNVAGNWSNTGTFTPRAGTVTFNGTSAQTIYHSSSETFNTLVFSNAGTKTQLGHFTASGNITINSGSGALIGNGFNISVAGNWVDNSSFTPGTGTVTFNGTTAQIIQRTGGETFNNMIFLGAGTKTLNSAITANGNITINTGSGAFVANNNNIAIAGNWSNSATFTPGANTVTFNGTGGQTIGGTTTTVFKNLTINDASGITLSVNTSVSGVLAFTAGVITTGTFKVTITSIGSVTGAGTGKFVNGILEKNVATGTNVSRLYEVGVGTTDYMPLTLTFASVSVAGNIAASVNNGDHPNITTSCIDASYGVNLYWRLTNTGTTFTTYTALCNFLAGYVDAGSTTSSFFMSVYSGGVWNYVPTQGAANPTSNTGSGITAIGDLGIGQKRPPLITTQAASASICNGSGVVFSVVVSGIGLTYQWQLNTGSGFNNITNGGIYSGATTANLTISAVSLAMNNYQYRCIVSSTCGTNVTSSTAILTVNPSVAVSVSIAASPTGAICAGTSVTFTATPTNGGTTPSYQWKINGGNVGTNSNTFTSTTLANGNAVTCVVTSNATCPTGNPATSNTINMTVNPNLPVSVSIAGTSTICAGTSITFTATPTNGGTTPSYQWKKNGTNVGTNSTTYTNAALANGDVITCVLTSNATCPTGNPATSNSITMTVNPILPVSVSIAGSNPICSGTSVTFTATPTNGGTTPSYQWKRNGTNVGTNSTTYTNAALSNGDVITCVLTSNATCPSGNPATSNSITMTVNPNLAVSVNITRSPAGAICSGTSVTFTATPTNGGTTPSYQWKVNGTNVGTNSTTYTSTTLANSDAVTCVLTSNATCATGNPATSNTITMSVNPNLPVSVSISASPSGSICSGTSVTFTAAPTNGGTTPAYQWKKNGTNVGTNSTTYTSTTLANNDVITCVLTSNATCATGNPATSNSITMTVGANLPASVSISGSSTICSGTSTTFTATPTNGGVTPAYQWKKNNVNIGTNSSTFTASGLVTGDVIKCVMTSSLACATGNPATSNSITMTVNTSVTASVAITASPTGAICAGTNVTFTAAPTNGGTTPSYQWKVNGTNVGTNSTTYSSTTLANTDVVTCVMTSNATCATPNPATSNAITMTVNPNLPVSVSIAGSNTICAGTSVTFTATPTNGGTTPAYQWQKNGTNVGTNSTTYTNAALANGDVITCVLTSNATCATGSPATSNSITMTVNPNLPVSVSIASGVTTICAGTSITFTATPTNPGTTPAYQWKKNGTNVGTNSTTYTNAALANGDVITCVLTSNATCATGNPATSNSITMTVNPTFVVSVSIAANPTGTICPGASVTFTATPTNPGTTPSYQWQLNGGNVGTNSTTYTNASLTNGDVITCILTSNVTCPIGNPATSNSITESVSTTVTWLGTTSSDWNDPTNWCGAIPVSTVNVVVNSGAPNFPQVTTPGASCKNLTINSGASLGFSGTANLNISGNYTNNGGTLNPGSGTITFNGTSAQTILKTGGEVFNNIVFSGAGTKTLMSAITVNGDVTVNSGSGAFTANNFNIILSGNWSSSGAAFVPGTQTITFNGVTQTVSRTGGETFNNVILANSGTKTLGSNISLNGGLTINSGVTLDEGSGNNNLSLKGDWNNNGVLVPQQGMVTFNGTNAQLIKGSANTVFYNLTCNNSSAAGVKLSSDQSAANIVDVQSGPLDLTTNTLTLLSSATNTALVYQLTGATANVTGSNLRVQRYIGGQTGWYQMGTPVTGLTVGDLTAYFYTSGFPGSSNPAYWFTSVYWYDETAAYPVIDSGWVAPTGMSEPVSDKGYICYIGPNPITVNMKGPHASKTGVNIPLTNTNTGAPNVDGWNFVTNPYPAPIDWDNVTLSGQMANEIQIWNDVAQQYGVYVQGTGGIGTNGVTNVIASSQSFWTYCTAGTTLALKETDKTTASAAFIKHFTPGTINTVNGNARQLRLKINGNTYSDEALINFVNGSTVNYDPYFDASKFYSFNAAVPGINTVVNDPAGDIDLAINSIPDNTVSITIPVRATTGTSGVFTISAQFLGTSPGSCLVLEDLLTSTSTTLTGNNTYTFSMSDTTKAVRFLLHIGAPVTVSATAPTCSGITNGVAIAEGTGAGPFDYTWLDANNNIVQSVSSVWGADTLSGLTPGTYSVTISGNSGGCPQLTSTVVIGQPAAIAADIAVTNATCSSIPNGSADAINITNGTAPYTYAWSTGDTLASAGNLAPGTYQLIISDAAGCSSQYAVNIGTVTLPIAISTTMPTCTGSANGSIIASGIGAGPFDYTWTDENNIPVRSVTNVNGADTLNNIAAGNYVVTVSGNTGTCNQLSETISVASSDSARADLETMDISCNNMQDGSVMLNGIVNGTAPYTYSWSTGASTPSLSNLAEGDYQLTISDANNCQSHYNITIGAGNSVHAVILAPDTVYINTGTTVAFDNDSENGFMYEWNFGDGSPADSAELPEYTYAASPATYTVQLIASNGSCADTTYHTLYVMDFDTTNHTTSVTNPVKADNSITLQHLPGTTFINVQLEQEEKILLSIYNSEGKLMGAPQQHVLRSGKIPVMTDGFDAGVYYIRCTHGSRINVFKIIQAR